MYQVLGKRLCAENSAGWRPTSLCNESMFPQGGIMTITEVSKTYGITPETLRYYERIGLLPKIGKDSRGRRLYTETDVEWVGYVARLRRAGVSIESLLDYIHLFHEGEGTEKERRDILLGEKERIEARIRELEEARDYLDLKIRRYDECIRPFEKAHLR